MEEVEAIARKARLQILLEEAPLVDQASSYVILPPICSCKIP
jgi:hypothetical protein